MSILDVTRTVYATDCMTGEQILYRINADRIVQQQRRGPISAHEAHAALSMSERMFRASDRAEARGEVRRANKLWIMAAKLAYEGR